MPVAVRRLDAPTVRKRTEEGYSPLLRCDECGKEIAKPEVGLLAWNAEENATYLSPIFLHEGCLDACRGTTQARLRVDPLQSFLTSLAPYHRGGDR